MNCRTPGFGASSEAIVRQGVFDHLVVQNLTLVQVGCDATDLLVTWILPACGLIFPE